MAQLAMASLQALSKLSLGVLPPPAVLPIAVLHVYMAHDAARDVLSGAGSADGVAPPARDGVGGPPGLLRLDRLPPRPSAMLQAALLHVLRLLAHLLRSLPRGAHMLAAAATLARCVAATEDGEGQEGHARVSAAARSHCRPKH
eukprot:3668738-Prymnesium_polylepis.1